MANKIIYLNNKKYSIDEALLSVAINVLKNHFGTAMEGEGANIEFDNVKYPIDSTKLDTARTDFISTLQSIAGEGEKVTISGIEFSIDSAKIEGAFDSFTTVLEDLKEQSGGSDSLPAGLYQTGAIALYEEQGAGAIEGMMITPYEELLANGTIHVEDGIIYTNADTDEWENSSSEALAGDLILPNDGSITTLGDFSDTEWAGRPAFMLCTNLTGIKLPNNITCIGDYAIDECESLVSIIIPDSVESIGAYAFSGCHSLTNITIPNGVTNISYNAFSSCRSLMSVAIGNGVTSIGEDAFSGCMNLMSVFIGDSVTSIGRHAFNRCYRLVEVVNKSSYITIEQGATSNGHVGYYACAVYNSSDVYAGTKLFNDNGYIIYMDDNEKILVGYNGMETDLVLPSYITKINQYAFYDCNSLTSVVIPDSVTLIGIYAFERCYNMTSAVIGDGVIVIGAYAFGSCSSLESVTIGSSVMEINHCAFLCQGLNNIIFNGTIAQWNGITKIGSWNSDVPATYVQCSDGQVAL